jgi:hypothetical protein
LVNGQTVTADARNADSTWLHIDEPAGWVFAELVNSPSDVTELSVLTDPAMPLQTVLQSFSLHSGAGTAQCPQQNHNGLLIQSPLENTPARLVVNGVDLALNGTVYLQALDTLIVQLLEGTATVTAAEVSQQLIAGTQTAIPLDAAGMAADIPGDLQPYAEDTIAALPLILLDREFDIAAALSVEELAALSACVISAPTNVNLRSGPGTAYPLLGSLEAESSTNARGQIVGADQMVWWQLADESWVRSDVVEAGENCDDVPVVDDVAEPPALPAASGAVDVVYRMEICSPAAGVPVAGQVIGFSLSGGSWPTQAEARQVIPELTGTVTVDGVPLTTTISTLEWGENNYGVTLQGTWTATAGTHAVSARLALFGGLFGDCNITIDG